MAKEIARSRCLPARRPVGGARTASGRDEEKRKFFVLRERLLAEREEEFYCRQKATFGSERAGLRMKFGLFLARD